MRDGGRRAALGVTAVAATALVVALAAPQAPRPEPPSTALPPSVRPAFTPGAPRALQERHLSRWAVVRRAVLARSAPRPEAPAITPVDT
ncbi:MAG: hypothetical protein M3P39_05725 [Actinomycetota bacterium]|nr:hypothetical protein [Actinomycetota bacterium]